MLNKGGGERERKTICNSDLLFVGKKNEGGAHKNELYAQRKINIKNKTKTNLQLTISK